MFSVSVIITAYQAEKTIGTAIQSVLNTYRKNEIEIIVVDDCSSDGTCDVIRCIQENNPNVKLYSMPQNSGGPSAPRNFGVRVATGEYVTFLDDDDEMIADNLLDMTAYIKKQNADFGKGYLISVDGDRRNVYNRVFDKSEEKNDVIRNIIASQSMNSDIIVKRELILKYNLEYRTDIRIGEDSVFITSVMLKAERPLYVDNYFLIHYNNPANITNLSSTQNVSDKEIRHQILSWRLVQEQLKDINVNYYKLRLPAGFRNLLLSIVRYSNGISEEAYKALYEFALETKSFIKGAMNLSQRYEELYEAILSGDYNQYINQAKRRLLINGYDLKFILPLVKYFEKDYIVKVDEWTGHNMHKEAESKKLAQWADIIWCEWLLGNAVYYTKMKNKNQRLVIRAHRFELWREFGFQVDWSKVDMIFTVGYYYFEQFISKFSIPREKMHLLSNYVEDSIYDRNKTEDAKYNVALVGILPKRKGFFRGLQMLKILVEKEPRFKLYIMGKSFHEISWIKNNPSEKEYYEMCKAYIRENNLNDHVVYGGFVEREKLYNNLGYVVSLSDNEEPESFHLAPAEGACAGGMGLILRWAGVEYIYPEKVIYNSVEDMAEEILKAAKEEAYYKEMSDALREYVIDHYSIKNFLDEINRYLIHIRIAG